MLSQEQKEMYADVINKIFEGNMHVESNEITQDVADTAEQMCSEIVKCSQSIAALGFDIIYTLTVGPLIPGIIAKVGAVAGKELIKDWLTALFKNYQSVICVNSAKANYRSHLYYLLYLSNF